tara:strand:- start:178 stop:627 length:450 start_codon:yes stop_codon:yes gene_type:complete
MIYYNCLLDKTTGEYSMPFEIKEIPSVFFGKVKPEDRAKQLIAKYPNQRDIINGCCKNAMILEQICLENSQAGGHRFLEIKSLFSWDEKATLRYWNKDKDGIPKEYCQADGSFAYYVLTTNSLQEAIDAMMEELEIVHGYACKIESTDW